MQHRLAAQIFSFLGPVFHPRLSLTSLWVLGTASSDRPCLNKMDSTTLLEQKGCLAFHFSTNNWKLVYHVNKYKAIQYPTTAPSSSPFFPEYAPQEFLVTFHEKQPQAGCPFHPWPCGTIWCLHLCHDAPDAFHGCSCLASTLFVDGCAGWGLQSLDQLAEWIAEATLAQGPGDFRWQRQSSAVGQLGQTKLWFQHSQTKPE